MLTTMKRSSNRSRLIFILILSLLLAGCRTYVPVVTTKVETIEKVRTQVKYDSIYVLDSTIIYKDSLIEHWRERVKIRYVDRTDTLHQVDTLLKETVRIVKQPVESIVYRQTYLQRLLGRIGLFAILTLVIWLVSQLNWKNIIQIILKLLKK